jgi:hypothetical protein
MLGVRAGRSAQVLVVKLLKPAMRLLRLKGKKTESYAGSGVVESIFCAGWTGEFDFPEKIYLFASQ